MKINTVFANQSKRKSAIAATFRFLNFFLIYFILFFLRRIALAFWNGRRAVMISVFHNLLQLIFNVEDNQL
jgi:hypothetical protein